MKKSNFKIVLTLLTLIPILWGLTAEAQTQFLRAIGGTGADVAYSIIQTSDGGYVAAGWQNSFGAGGNDMYIVKFDGGGTLQWSRTIGGTGDDRALSIIQTPDGGYTAVGYNTSFGAGDYDIIIVKLNGSGTLQWTKTVGGTLEDYGYSIIRTTDGGYAVGSQINSFGAGSYDFQITKLDSGGTLQWSKTVGGTGSDFAFSIVQTPDGGYALAGETESFGSGNSDMYIVKFDNSGTLLWSKTIGGTGFDRARTFTKTTDGGFALVGQTTSFGTGGTNFDTYIVKLDSIGTLQWSRTVGGTGVDFAYSIVQTTNGEYVAGGFTTSFGAGNNDCYFVKLDASGTFQWNRTVGGTGNDFSRFIIQTTDGGYAAASQVASFGVVGTDVFIVKLDGSGNTCGNTTTPPSPTLSSGGITTSPTSTVTTPIPTVTSPTPTTNTGGTVTSICTSVSPVASSLNVIVEGFYNPGTEQLNIRDTVRAYLRNTSTPFAVVDSAKSVIDSVTFAGSFLFANAPTGIYYIQLKHRNAIETWSRFPGQSYTLGSALVYNFTDSVTKAFGNNMKQVDTSPPRFAIYSGDVNQDGIIDAGDLSLVDNDVFSSISGYVKTDVTGDNFVDASDLSIVDNNVFNSVIVVRP